MKWVRSLYRRLLAIYRLDLHVVCEESVGIHDYHDYEDDIYGQPWHFVEMKCMRCGKAFYI